MDGWGWGVTYYLSRLLVRVLITKLSNSAADHLLNMRLHKQVSTIKYVNNELLRRWHRIVHVHYELCHWNIAGDEHSFDGINHLRVSLAQRDDGLQTQK